MLSEIERTFQNNKRVNSSGRHENNKKVYICLITVLQNT